MAFPTHAMKLLHFMHSMHGHARKFASEADPRARWPRIYAYIYKYSACAHAFGPFAWVRAKIYTAKSRSLKMHIETKMRVLRLCFALAAVAVLQGKRMRAARSIMRSADDLAISSLRGGLWYQEFIQ